MKERVKQAVVSAFQAAVSRQILAQAKLPRDFQITIPKIEAHGDFSTNIAMVMASKAKMPPRKIAEALLPELSQVEIFEKVEIAGPGFINFFISKRTWQDNLRQVFFAGENFYESDTGKGKKVLVEFVSANPTGPLHVGHGRGAAVGDTLSRILKAAGFNVETEYYINDVGNQMRTLGSSVYLRYLEHFGKKIEFPNEYYQGDYIKDIARQITQEVGDRFLEIPLEKCLPFFIDHAVEKIFAGIKKDLSDFGVHFDRWFSEKALHSSGLVEKALDVLKKRGHIYEKDGALWFRSSAFGDEKDRVVRRSTGELTYFAADIAYHMEKLQRGYELLVDIWGGGSPWLCA